MSYFSEGDTIICTSPAYTDVSVGAEYDVESDFDGDLYIVDDVGEPLYLGGAVDEDFELVEDESDAPELLTLGDVHEMLEIAFGVAFEERDVDAMISAAMALRDAL